ncbi:hypothetical protein BGZ67_002344 [Mortierella alpina]|nr:hypothetical protein BGZ67_002344 [Mortierella alpina]
MFLHRGWPGICVTHKKCTSLAPTAANSNYSLLAYHTNSAALSAILAPATRGCTGITVRRPRSRNLEAIINAAVIGRFSQNPTPKRIKTLRLPANLSGIRNPLPLLLIKSKLLDLETCEIPWFRGDVTTWEIEQVVQEHCSNLKHLECPQNFEEGQDGQAARAFIRGCTGLRSFTSAYFMDGPDHAPHYILSEVVAHHHTTLEVLALRDPLQVFSRDLQKVLSQCKQLKRFWVIGEDDAHDMPGIAFRDIFRSDWVCTELRELGVILNRCRSQRDASGELGEEEQQDDPYVWLTASTTKRAYQQIGHLKKLEVLVIDIDKTSGTKAKEQDYAWDLTFGKEDVEFMYEHWPLLEEIVIAADIEEFYNKQHWQWLLEKRPKLRFEGVVRY